MRVRPRNGPYCSSSLGGVLLTAVVRFETWDSPKMTTARTIADQTI